MKLPPVFRAWTYFCAVDVQIDGVRRPTDDPDPLWLDVLSRFQAWNGYLILGQASVVVVHCDNFAFRSRVVLLPFCWRDTILQEAQRCWKEAEPEHEHRD